MSYVYEPLKNHNKTLKNVREPQMWGEAISIAIRSLKQGGKDLHFTAQDRNGDKWNAYVHVNEDGAWEVNTMWGVGGPHWIPPGIGEVTFYMRREFTKPEYAYDHLLSNSC